MEEKDYIGIRSDVEIPEHMVGQDLFQGHRESCYNNFSTGIKEFESKLQRVRHDILHRNGIEVKPILDAHEWASLPPEDRLKLESLSHARLAVARILEGLSLIDNENRTNFKSNSF